MQGADVLRCDTAIALGVTKLLQGFRTQRRRKGRVPLRSSQKEPREAHTLPHAHTPGS